METISYRGYNILHVIEEHPNLFRGYYVGAIYFGQSNIQKAQSYIDMLIDEPGANVIAKETANNQL